MILFPNLAKRMECREEIFPSFPKMIWLKFPLLEANSFEPPAFVFLSPCDKVKANF